MSNYSNLHSLKMNIQYHGCSEISRVVFWTLLEFFWGEAAIQLPQPMPLEAPPARPAHPVAPDAAATVPPVTAPVAAAATPPPVAPEPVMEMPLPKRLGW